METYVLLIASIIGLVLLTVGKKFYRFYQFRRKLEKIPGPTFAIPLFGLVCKLMTIPKHDRLDWFKSVNDEFKDGVVRTWLGTSGSVHIHKPEHIEVILRSNTEITKSRVYDLMRPWLGNGLLTSTGSEWLHARKLITPAFHFKILEQFSEVMIDKANILTDCIEREIKINGDKPFDIFPLAVKAALDVICETAMGIDVHAQEEVESEYIRAVHAISAGVTVRFFQPWYALDFLFYNSAMGKAFASAIKTTHEQCCHVIRRKQQERQHGYATKVDSKEDRVNNERKKVAFLDLLLDENEKEGNPLTFKQIMDQVNTFMFAGHDTTGALVSWTLFCLGNELEVQKKVHEELDEILGDADNETTLKQLPNLKYLERVIKEVLRLYPSATGFSRKIMEDLKIGDYTVPKGAILNVQVYQLHRDPSVWPDPLRFDPDRFLPENVRNRNPYAFIPFSAGPRNCIGQKYAMLEAKITLAQVLRKFSIRSAESHATIKKYSEIILRPANGIFVNMKKRFDSAKDS